LDGTNGDRIACCPGLVTESCLILLKLRCAHRSALLETFPAENRASLRWPEGYRRLLAALRAVGLGFRPHLQAAVGVTTTATFGASGLAGLTSLGFVLEAFVGEKHLFAGSKYELGAALRTLQDPIVIFHEALPLAPREARGWVNLRGEA
jgi:hypothetical protein